mmetsp:Transcript_69650/g.201950  ORF Transcript_69650/g.201950 Transcript_69650/m.201950 type:complete len:371 (+) Transcript_69650:714-1826(+)
MACKSSDLSVWYFVFSSVRLPSIHLMSSATCASLASTSALSASIASMARLIFSFFASLFLIFQANSLMVELSSWYWFVQPSTRSLSCLSSLASCNKSSSIAFRTSSKCPAPPACTAMAASRKLWAIAACFFNTRRAFANGVSSTSAWSCMKLAAPTPGLMALPNNSLASSLVRMVSASEMPASSSARRDLRVPHSSVFATHEAFVASKYSMSAWSCFSMSPYCTSPSASSVSACVFSARLLARVVCIVANSLAYVAMRSSKFVCLVASSELSCCKVALNESYMSCKMPWMVADCGVYPEAMRVKASTWSAVGFDRGDSFEIVLFSRASVTDHFSTSALLCRSDDVVADFNTMMAFSSAEIACSSSASSAR